MTHGSRQPSQYPYECWGLDRKRARTHEQVTNGQRGVGDHVYNSFVGDPTGCNHQVGARVRPRVTQMARSRGVLPQIPQNTHELAAWPKSRPYSCSLAWHIHHISSSLIWSRPVE